METTHPTAPPDEMDTPTRSTDPAHSGGLDRPDPAREADRRRLARLLGALLAARWLRDRADATIDDTDPGGTARSPGDARDGDPGRFATRSRHP